MSQSQTITSLPITVQECLRKLETVQGFFAYKLEVKTCKSGNLSTSHEVVLKGRDKEICFFTKCIPENFGSSPFLPLSDFFLNEIFVYRRLRPLFEKLQLNAGVPGNERFTFVQFYDTASTQCLVMENMTLKGYKVPDRRASLSFPVAKQAVEKLAKYHALNIAMEKIHPDFFNEEIRGRKHLIDFVGLHETGGKEMIYQVIDLLKTNAAKMKVRRFVQDMMNKMMSFYKSDLDVAVLCHGDFRGQNLLTREMNGEVTDVLPIDYQLVHCGHPVNDLMYFIFLSTNQDFQRLHLRDLKTTYYASLKRFLSYFKVNAEDVYGEERFERDFKERLLLGLIQGFRLLPLMLARNEDMPDIFGESAQLNVASNNVLIKWINGLVEDFIEWGYL